jgi:uncharacterized LabA/DUF88 family protein
MIAPTISSPPTVHERPKLQVYVDGFNFYYRRLRNSPHRWLNLQTLFENLFPAYEVVAIHYYTARVSGKFNPAKPLRQTAYLKALSTLPKVHIHFGQFSSKIVNMRLAQPLQTVDLVTHATVAVWKQEEKGADVSLGVHLLHHAWQGQYQMAAVLTNDSDLAEPIRLVRTLGLPVTLIHPDDNNATSLSAAASHRLHLHDRHLKLAQFANTLTLDSGKTVSNPFID